MKMKWKRHLREEGKIYKISTIINLLHSYKPCTLHDIIREENATKERIF